MQQLPSNADGGPDSGLQKFIQYSPLILGAIALFYWWGTVVPFVLRTLEDTVKAGLYLLAILVVFGIYQANKKVLSMWYKTQCRKIGGIFIKMDPLSFMDRYADMLSEKLDGLRKTKRVLEAERISLENSIHEEEENYNKNMKLAQAALQQGNQTRANAYANDARGAKESITLYTPNYNRTVRSIDFLAKVSENWELSINGIRKFNARKRRQYKILKANAKALGQAEEFLKGDTEESRIYNESIRVAEEQMAGWLAFANDFEERAKPILEGAAIEKQMNDNEAQKMLDEFMSGNKLFVDLNKIEDADFKVVGSAIKQPAQQSLSGGSKYNFLK